MPLRFDSRLLREAALTRWFCAVLVVRWQALKEVSVDSVTSLPPILRRAKVIQERLRELKDSENDKNGKRRIALVLAEVSRYIEHMELVQAKHRDELAEATETGSKYYPPSTQYIIREICADSLTTLFAVMCCALCVVQWPTIRRVI